MKRTPEQIMEVIADATPAQMQRLHKVVELAPLSEERKAHLHKMFMLLGMVGQMGKPKERIN